MIITNIRNVSNGEEYGKYINSLNIVNSILDGTYKNNNNNYNDDKEALQLCSQLLLYQLSASS